MNVELDYLRDELADTERLIAQKERAALEHRVVDEGRWLASLRRLRDRRDRLRRLLAEEDVA